MVPFLEAESETFTDFSISSVSDSHLQILVVQDYLRDRGESINCVDSHETIRIAVL